MTNFLDLSRRSTRLWALAILLVIGVLSTALIYVNRWNWPPIRSDGVGYYAYLPAVIVYRDLTMAALYNIPSDKLEGYQPFGPWTGINRFENTGRYLDKYGMGVAFLMLPFFLAAHCISVLCSFGEGGFGLPYQFASIASALIYFCAGVAFLYGLLRNFFSHEIVFCTLAVHIFGTGLFHYATYDGSFSHVYSFFLVSIFLYVLYRYREHRAVCSVLCGFLLGLIFLTRPPNIIFGLFFALFGVAQLSDLSRVVLDRKWFEKMALFCAVFVITASPQLFYWKYITGRWLVYSYVGEGFNWWSPEFFNVLFSVRKGLFFWSPVLLASTVGFFFMRTKVPDFFGPLVVFFPLNVYIISSWSCWWYGGSLGQRPFVESVPLFAIGLASLLAGIRSPRVRSAVMMLLFAGTALAVTYMVLYWRGVIPFDGMTWGRYLKIFLGI